MNVPLSLLILSHNTFHENKLSPMYTRDGQCLGLKMNVPLSLLILSHNTFHETKLSPMYTRDGLIKTYRSL